MSREQTIALVEMMNAVKDDRRLVALSNEVFGGVVPLRNREHQDHVVRAAVALLASGTSRQATVQILGGVSALNLGPDRLDLVVNRVCELAETEAYRVITKEPDIATALKAALSYAALMDGHWNGSPELEAMAEERGGDDKYNKAGRDAMLTVMRFLSNPKGYEITRETAKLADSLTTAVRFKALEAAHATSDEKLEDIIIEENGQMFAVIQDRHGVRNVEIAEAAPAPEPETELVM